MPLSVGIEPAYIVSFCPTHLARSDWVAHRSDFTNPNNPWPVLGMPLRNPDAHTRHIALYICLPGSGNGGNGNGAAMPANQRRGMRVREAKAMAARGIKKPARRGPAGALRPIASRSYE
jgi:hypothetical protein